MIKLLLPLLAWIVPCVGISRQLKAYKPLRSVNCAAVSLGACAAVLWLQLSHCARLVERGALGTLEDIAGATCGLSLLLLAVTLILNIFLVLTEGALYREMQENGTQPPAQRATREE